MLETLPQRLVQLTGPSVEPLALTDAKKHLEIADSSSDHDDHIRWLIEAARQQWEHDTHSATIEQQWELTTDQLKEMRFSLRPVKEIESVVYFDSSNAQQTLASSVYQLDKSENAMRLAVNQDWPAVYERWDAVTVTLKVGNYALASAVPAIVKQAMLLLIGHYFEDRGEPMSEAMRNMKSYEMLVRRFMRYSYP